MKPKPLILTCSKGDGHFRYGDGSLKDDQRQRRLLAAALKGLPDGPYVLEIRPLTMNRRARQNAWLWGVCYREIALETGYDLHDVHELMKLRHNFKLVVDPATGEEVKIGVTTTLLTVQAFSDYIEAVMLDGAEWCGISWPEPRASEEYREGVTA